MATLYEIGEKYLQKLTLIENGGFVKIILDNLQIENGAIITKKIQNVGLWASYVKEVLFNSTRFKPVRQNQTYLLDNMMSVDNPNRVGFIVLICWIVTFVILVSLLYFTSQRRYLKDKNDKKKIKNFRFILARTKRRMMCRTRIYRILVIFCMCLAIAVWIMFMSMLCTTQYLISSKLSDHQDQNNSAQTYPSINDAVSISFTYLNNFYNIITNKTGVFLGARMTTLGLNIRNQLKTSIMGFGNEILSSFNITDMFTTAKQLLNSCNEIITSMVFIKDNCEDTLAEINSVNVSVSILQIRIADSLNIICNSVKNNTILLGICTSLQSKNLQLKTDIKTSSVDPSSSTFILNTLQRYHVNITDITKTFYKVDKTFHRNLNSMLNSTINRFDISSYLSVVTDIWSKVVAVIGPPIASVMNYNTLFRSTLDSVSKYENFVTIILIFLVFVTILLVLLLSFRDSIEVRYLNRYIDFGVQFLFLVVLTISAVFCVVVLMATTVSQSEICNQVTTSDGINVLDQMINSKIRVPWNTNVVAALVNYKNVNISIAQPTNVISGIKDRCQNTSMGLFKVLAMGNFINVTQITRSQSIMDIIYKAENESLKAFLDVHPEQMIPKNLPEFLVKTEILINYFDTIDYSTGIKELQKPIVGIEDFVGYFSDLLTFSSNASEMIGWTNDLVILNNSTNQLITMSPNLTLTQRKMTKLAAMFTVLENNRNNSVLINRLRSIINNVKNTFANTSQIVAMFSSLYQNLITISLLNNVTKIVGDSFSDVIYQMVPCNDLSMIYSAITTSVCANTEFNVSLAAFGLMLLAETIICQIISIIVMVSSSLRLNYEDNVSVC